MTDENRGHVWTFMEAFGVIGIAIVCIIITLLLDSMLYRNTEVVYCDCTVVGKAQTEYSNIVYFGCKRNSLYDTTQHLSELEWQAVDVGDSVIVVQTRHSLVDDTRYEIMFSYPGYCEDR